MAKLFTSEVINTGYVGADIIALSAMTTTFAYELVKISLRIA